MLIPRVRLVAASVAIAVSLLASPSVRAGPKPIVRLEYRADASCPGPSRFMAEVAARIPGEVTWVGEPFSQHFEVELTQAAGVYRATLQVRDASGVSNRREFRAERCDEAVSAVALVAALAVDPNASIEPGSAIGRRSVAPLEAADPARLESSKWRAEAGPSAAWLTGATPVNLVAIGLTAGVSSRGRLWAPAFRLGALVSRTGTVTPGTSVGSFGWNVARALACPIWLGLDERVSLRPCALADLGWMRVEGSAAQGFEARDVSHFWAALGPSVLAEYAVGRFGVEVGAGVLANLDRKSYVLREPYVPVYTAKRALITVQLGVRLAF